MKALGIVTDLQAGEAAVRVPKAVTSQAALTLAAQVFARRAEAYVGGTKTEWELTLKARRAGLSEPQLAALAGDFLVELLNQEVRSLVSALNKDVASLQAAQALFSARGGEKPPPRPKEGAAFKKAAAKLLAEAKAELSKVARTGSEP